MKKFKAVPPLQLAGKRRLF